METCLPNLNSLFSAILAYLDLPNTGLGTHLYIYIYILEFQEATLYVGM
jgi:hypothetical protein